MYKEIFIYIYIYLFLLPYLLKVCAMSAGTGSTLYAAASVAAAPAASAGTGVAVAGVAGAAGATLWWTVAAVCPPVLTAGMASIGYAYWTNLSPHKPRERSNASIARARLFACASISRKRRMTWPQLLFRDGM